MKGTTIVVNVHHGQMMPYSGAPLQFLDISGKLIHQPKRQNGTSFLGTSFLPELGRHKKPECI